MAYSSMYNSPKPVVFDTDTLSSRQLCTLNSYINNKRIPGWTVNTDNYSVEDLQLFHSLSQSGQAIYSLRPSTLAKWQYASQQQNSLLITKKEDILFSNKRKCVA